MARTRPERRIVTAAETIQDQIDAFETPEHPEDFAPPPTAPEGDKKLNYRARLLRRLRMADMALLKYEVKLERFSQTRFPGDALSPEEERLFIAHQEHVRKLEATLAALDHKAPQEEDKTDVEMSVDLFNLGWSLPDILKLFPHNKTLETELSLALEQQSE